MIYWLIPYLVAYNASEAGNWKYGPEHVFKAEVRGIAATNKMTVIHLNIDIYLACRPMNSSLIQCRVESATTDSWSIDADGTSSPESHSPEPMQISNAVFQVEFNKDGVSELRLINATERFQLDMFRAIFDTVHWGIDISGQKYGRYDRVEKSMIGSCETTFDIGRKTLTKVEINAEKAVYGYTFDVPAFEGRTGNEPFVIEKNRHVDRCSEQTFYLFENADEEEEFYKKHDLTKKTQVTSSRSQIYIGSGGSFSGYTRNIGTLEYSSYRPNTLTRFANVDLSIHLFLEVIRSAKEDIRQTRDSWNSEAGTP